MKMEEFGEVCKKAAGEIEAAERRTYELLMDAVLVMVAGGENMLGFDLANAMVEAEKQLKKEYNEQWGDSNNEGKSES